MEKILLKAVFKKGKKDPKTFTLRDIDRATVLSGCEALKILIRKNLKDDITSGDFDVGYIQGSSVVRVRSAEDLVELWSCLSEKTTTLWCDGLCTKRKHSDDEDDDYPPRKVHSKRNDTDSKRVQDTVEELKVKHGSQFTQMQFRIWAELIVGGMHSSIDNPPENNSMFLRAGGGEMSKRKTQDSPVAQALTNVASAITSAISSKLPQEQTNTRVIAQGVSPAKIIDNRSKLYKQLSELKNLMTAGILSEDEYLSEKETIMDLLKQLKS